MEFEVQEILDIIEAFFNAIKEVFAGLKDVFGSLTGSDEATTTQA